MAKRCSFGEFIADLEHFPTFLYALQLLVAQSLKSSKHSNNIVVFSESLILF